ncbi:hypothetical protein SAMN02745866_00285 [Alteromonadaceae bacterium Bs31]|nr:hypothetical protein SAMN02745866_00285 [Alteromonadaceae bacterium Bs31]
MKKSVNDWVEIANQFISDSSAKISCPGCKAEFIKCQNVVDSDNRVIEKRIYCESCKIEHYIRL